MGSHQYTVPPARPATQPRANQVHPPTRRLAVRPARRRACEEVLYGKEGVSLITSREVSRAAELARWIVVDSKLYPRNRDQPMMSNMVLGGYEDQTTTVGGPGQGGEVASCVVSAACVWCSCCVWSCKCCCLLSQHVRRVIARWLTWRQVA